MLETQSASTFESTSEPSATQQKTALRLVPESLGEVAATPAKVVRTLTIQFGNRVSRNLPKRSQNITAYLVNQSKSGFKKLRTLALGIASQI
jgi:hypothetical protein